VCVCVCVCVKLCLQVVVNCSCMMLLWVYEFKLQKLCGIAAVFMCSFAGKFLSFCLGSLVFVVTDVIFIELDFYVA
jgi:hypothetical protein